jgi:hypothetical protein
MLRKRLMPLLLVIGLLAGTGVRQAHALDVVTQTVPTGLTIGLEIPGPITVPGVIYPPDIFVPWPWPVPTGPEKLSINLPSVVEVREEQGHLMVPIICSTWYPKGKLEFEIVTMDGTANAGSDYVRPVRAQVFQAPRVIYLYPRIILPTYPGIPGYPIANNPPTYPIIDQAASELFTQTIVGPRMPGEEPLTVVGPGSLTIIAPQPWPSWPWPWPWPWPRPQPPPPAMLIPIRILNPPNTAGETTETFTVAIRPAKGSKTLIGQPSMVTVRIIDSVDDKPPKPPTIVRPAELLPKGVQPGSPVVVSGLATDNKGVNLVEVYLNGAFKGNAKLSSPGMPHTLYSMTVTPDKTVNELSVRAVDAGGRASPETRRTFRYRTESPLVVNVDATMGTLSPAGFAGSTMREEGMKHTITVKPMRGTLDDTIFERWIVEGAKLQDIGVTPADLLDATLTFIHRAGLKLTAHFSPNRFPRGASHFVGVLRSPPEKFARTLETSGFISLNVLSNGTLNGVFSARLLYDGVVHRIVGRLAQPWAREDLPGVSGWGADHLIEHRGKTLSLQLRLWNTAPHPFVECAVSDNLTIRVNAQLPVMQLLNTGVNTNRPGPHVQCQGEARRALYDGVARSVPTLYLAAQGAAGLYTSTMYAYNDARLPALRYEDFSQASGAANMSIAKNGAVTYFGRLSDDTPFAASTVVVDGMVCPVFVPLYDSKGFFTTELKLQAGGLESDATGTRETWWCRPKQDTINYPEGWPQSLFVQVLAAKYPHAPDRTLFYHGSPTHLNLNPPRPEGNVALHIGDYSTGPPEWNFPQSNGMIFSAINVADDGTVTAVSGQPGGWTLTVDPATGRFHGTFAHPDGTSPEFQGVIYQYGNNSHGHGYFTTKLPNEHGGTGFVYISPFQYGVP